MKRSRLIKPLLDQHYPMISHGKGVYLYDKDGNKYLDASSGAVTASIGHGVQGVVEAIMEQAQKVAFVYRSQFTSEPAEELAEKLCSLSHDHFQWAFFVNSGTEATETAMKIALQHWQEQGQPLKTKVLSRWMSYHGITLGALSMSGHAGRRSRFVPLLEEFPSVSAPYCYRCPLQKSYPSCQLACAKELERIIKRIGTDHIAAFITEPIIGAAGAAVTPPDGYYEEIREICDKYNILWIADEVMTGIGRTGEMFAYEHWSVKPDIITLGKGLSAGYTPIAVTMATASVVEPILRGSKLIMSGHTLSANPLSAATALSVINYIEEHQLVKAAKKKGDYLIKALHHIQSQSRLIGDVRGKGLLIGIEIVKDKESKESFSPLMNITSQIVKKAQSKGLLLYPAQAGIDGIDGDAVMIAPPFTITDDEMEELLYLFTQTMVEVESELRSAEGD
ncbi:aspartate aminotransferase family protein [Metabacillus iocasae]|uniref:Adenosylmethionine-8-amino-7-oxononanoate aminotransferase n=1 Tax=Priestia iocasae TaxID=2291674 RepID=A0ABS2QWR3_9BACI|nr:aspartate aminotransferase family protein [Metabacillus iocasae]MBM7703186.1 adenosylmethionine-8-amino-7-oxononanoate aminotransferase [Metabacillus iocasae]